MSNHQQPNEPAAQAPMMELRMVTLPDGRRIVVDYSNSDDVPLLPHEAWVSFPTPELRQQFAEAERRQQEHDSAVELARKLAQRAEKQGLIKALSEALRKEQEQKQQQLPVLTLPIRLRRHQPSLP